MAKKKHTQSPKENFQRNPFSDLKGFAASAREEKESEPELPEPKIEPELSAEDLFAREMELLGVSRSAEEDSTAPSAADSVPEPAAPEIMSEQDQFLAALGEMSVRFEDQFPDDEVPHHASPRRMKLLKQQN